jgi:hypothetical protein
MSKEIKCLPAIETYMLGDSYMNRYRSLIYKVINEIYNMALNHPMFMSQLTCKYNSIHDVKYIFDDMTTNYLIMTYADGNNMECYNVMVDDNKFYNNWKQDLFTYIINNH